MRETMQNVNQYKFIDELRKKTPVFKSNSENSSSLPNISPEPDNWKTNKSIKWEKAMEV